MLVLQTVEKKFRTALEYHKCDVNGTSLNYYVKSQKCARHHKDMHFQAETNVSSSGDSITITNLSQKNLVGVHLEKRLQKRHHRGVQHVITEPAAAFLALFLCPKKDRTSNKPGGTHFFGIKSSTFLSIHMHPTMPLPGQ